MKKTSIITAAILCIAFASCQTAKQDPASSITALLIIPSSDVQDDELTVTKTVLENSGIKAVVAGKEKKPVNGMLGGTFEPDIAVADANPSDYSMIVFIGGNGAFGLYDDAQIHSMIRTFDEQGKIIAAICAAPGILANAGVLSGKEATCYPYEPISNLLTEKGAVYLDKPVVVSGRVITGNGAEASEAFAGALIKAVQG